MTELEFYRHKLDRLLPFERHGPLGKAIGLRIEWLELAKQQEECAGAAEQKLYNETIGGDW